MREFFDGLTTFEYVMIMVILVTSSISSVLKSIRTRLKIRILRRQTAILDAENRKLERP